MARPKYKSLDIVARLYKFLAVLVLLGFGIFAFMQVALAEVNMMSLVLLLLQFLGALLAAVTLAASGQILNVFMDIEEHLRHMRADRGDRHLP